LALFDRHGVTTDHFISPHNAIFEQQRRELTATEMGRSRPSVQSLQLLRPFLPEQVLEEIKAQGFDKLLIYPPSCRFHF